METNTDDIPTIVPYIASSVQRAPAIIICPGGGYSHRAEHEGGPIGHWLNTIGISAFVLNYRVAPTRYPAPLLDLERAIRYVRFHAAAFSIDRSSWGAWILSRWTSRIDCGHTV
ncbi:alpha/beta hydrolase [Alicyclobacillus fastidiosus]|uniref:alpha/beta hydrolase n=1 Tax=Alicyclobacillus fastidiosus TaxID=392011 RepID=UPI002DD42938|nr:alpha/beta hydrolase [Alicyclobacillus fastidiosus]